MRLLLAVLAAAAASVSAGAAGPVASPQPAKVAPHPRVVLTPAAVRTILNYTATNADAARFLALLREHADWAVRQPPVPHGTSGATGILDAVRKALDILLTCSLAWRLEGEPAHLDRAIEEALNLAVTWPDWNPVLHALDLGEAAAAVALTYDWLYTDLNATTRAAILAGIVSRGLTPYKQYIHTKTFWWMNNTINWNCVCSAGGVIATLATLDDEGAPDWAWDDVLSPLVAPDGVLPCVSAYSPDSSWEEGAAYISYASKYVAWNVASLQSVLGNDYGLSAVPGVAGASLFTAWQTGASPLSPNAELWDWADAHTTGATLDPFFLWWGMQYPDVAAAATYVARTTTVNNANASLHTFAWGGFAEALVFFTPLGSLADVAALPTAKAWARDEMAVFRSPWDAPAPQQNYIGFKGGNSSWNHNHLDEGSFVMDYAGVRIAEDMGGDSYELPGYFDPVQRWTYYRLNSRGHNVIMFGNESQLHDLIAAHLIAFASTPTSPAPGVTVDGYAVVDLTPAYANVAASYRRGVVSLNAAAGALVRDEIAYLPGGGPANLTWQLHTLTPAVLTPGGATLGAGVLASIPGSTACPGLTFVMTDLSKVIFPPQESAAGYSRIDGVAQAPASSGCDTLSFALGSPTLAAQFVSGSLALKPIDSWGAAGGPVAPGRGV